MQLSADESAHLDMKKIAALNPHFVEAKRTRWSEGFMKALGKE